MPPMKPSWVHRVILSAWRDIFETSESDESLKSLVNVLADRVESKVGVRPDDNDVIDFLRSLQRQETPPPPPPPPPPPGKGPRVYIKELVILGRRYHCRNQSHAMAIVFKKLQEENPEFLQRFYEHSENQRGSGRRYLGRNQRELFGPNEGERSHEKIGRDWVISTNYSWPSKKEIVRLAAKVAGLKFDRDIIIKFDD